ncbi:hypothetical protein [Helicobacter sp. MIT 14-3879]|uniref:hypothetical protein n=1 Tax=Helicobacter sp. MIT 14-3879 TaxID=2040649 RepID=UPI000E1FA31F|nr:hypothetical protein [Helicobacter sp. MIT 14-3879]RDU65171.1 hypothetical protein CQA44_02335 [Helicobacter sp. MIT 14-3879]
MRQDNYISFSIVVGFFIGLISSIIKFNQPELIILWTIVWTVIVYLIALCSASFYMKFIDYEKKKMNIKKLDSTLNYYLKEFDKREKETFSIRNYLKHISSINEKEE